MKQTDLNLLVGNNLRKFRLGSNMTQEQLSELLDVSHGLIPKWESGSKGIGKSVLLKLCRIFKVKPHAFYVDKNVPYISSSREQVIVYKFREAENLGVAEMIEQYNDYMIRNARKIKKRGPLMDQSLTKT